MKKVFLNSKAQHSVYFSFFVHKKAVHRLRRSCTFCNISTIFSKATRFSRLVTSIVYVVLTFSQYAYNNDRRVRLPLVHVVSGFAYMASAETEKDSHYKFEKSADRARMLRMVGCLKTFPFG